MYLDQTLENEKASISEYSFYCTRIFFKEMDALCFPVLYFFYRFCIQRFRFNLRKRTEQGLLKNENGMDYLAENKKTTDILRFEISSEKMNELLAQRQICAADIRCLDANSKKCLKNLCLKVCLDNVTYSNQVPRMVNEFNLSDSHLQIGQS